MMIRFSLLLLPLPLLLLCAPPSARQEAGRREVLRSCVRCHSLEVVAAQRLSRDEWEFELRKMAKMGARVREREAVLDFLAAQYGDPPSVTAPR